MTNPDPIACSLDSGELEARLATFRDVGRSALISHETRGNRHLLRFRNAHGTRAGLEEIVEAERRCCPFLGLELQQEGEEIVLSIEAPTAAEPTASGLVAAFTGASA
jgi:hypothetical protein